MTHIFFHGNEVAGRDVLKYPGGGSLFADVLRGMTWGVTEDKQLINQIYWELEEVS